MGLLNYRKPGGPAGGPRGLLDFLLDPDSMADGRAPSGLGASAFALMARPQDRAPPDSSPNGDSSSGDGLLEDIPAAAFAGGTTTAAGASDFQGAGLPPSSGNVIQLAAAQKPAPGQAQTQPPPTSGPLSARDRAFLDKYYPAASALAQKWGVDPAFVLGMGGESGFGTSGTYLRTGDAFGMTGGSTKHMTRASNPTENVQQFFDAYGPQIGGSGSQRDTFVNALQGLDASGHPVPGWKRYNKALDDKAKKAKALGKSTLNYVQTVTPWIQGMQRELPIYQQQLTRSGQ